MKDTILTVLEAYTRDIGRGVIRVDYDTMDELDASTGEVVEITGKRKTFAKILPLYPSDEARKIARADGLIRQNAGSAIGDKIAIRKAAAAVAGQVSIIPLEPSPPIDERYLTDALESIPITKGDNLTVPYFGGRLSFQVINIRPRAKVAIVTAKTTFKISKSEDDEDDGDAILKVSRDGKGDDLRGAFRLYRKAPTKWSKAKTVSKKRRQK